MTKKNGDQDEQWDRGWREHKTRQLVRLARLPFVEKLSWLESAQTLVDALASARNERVDGTRGHGG